MTDIIPAIDIIGGRCVRLAKGDYTSKTEYADSPVEMAMRYADCGVKRIHMVDLDGAKQSAPINLRILEQIASGVGVEIEWGGGIADTTCLQSVFDAGATQAVIGSVAVRKPDLMHIWLEKYGADKIILGADVREGKVAIKGWQEDSEKTIDDLLAEFTGRQVLTQVICTDISRDGMLKGPSFKLYEELQEKYPDIIFTVSGGISSMDDVLRISEMGLKRVIVGKAVYEGKISLNDIKQWSLNG